MTDHTLPHDDTAERTVLGAIIVDHAGVAVAQERLRPEDFYRDRHRLIFRAILDLAAAGKPPDAVVLRRHLEQAGQLEAVGGVAAISELMDGIPKAANVEHYAAIVAEAAVQRAIYRTASDVMRDVLESGSPSNEVLDRAVGALMGLQRTGETSRLEPVREAVREAADLLESLSRGPLLIGASYGLTDLDTQTGGMQRGELIVLAARPSVGKTAFALNVAAKLAAAGKRVAFFSLEMARVQLAMRLLCSQARVDTWMVRSGAVSGTDLERLVDAAGRVAAWPLAINDAFDVTLLDVRAKSRRYQSEGGLDLIVIDYLQLMRGDERAENRQAQVAKLSRGLKGVARDLNVPVMVLSQLNRESERRTDHRPQLSDLRESGAVEQDADTVLFLFKPHTYDESKPRDEVEVIVAKQRNGPVTVVSVHWDESTQRFNDLELHRVPA